MTIPTRRLREVPTKAQITSPPPGSTLTSSTVTFIWNSGTGVSEYWLSIGATPGGNQIYEQSQGTNLSVTRFRSANQREHAVCEALVADQRRVAME